jgi:hypothetical protein
MSGRFGVPSPDGREGGGETGSPGRSTQPRCPFKRRRSRDRDEARCGTREPLERRSSDTDSFRRALGRGLRRNGFSRLAVTKRGTLCLVRARGPATRLCGGAFPTTRALPPHPLQRRGQQLPAEALLPLRKLTNGEIRLLLAGAHSTEGYTPDLHDRSMGAGPPRPAPHLAHSRLRRPAYESPLPTDYGALSIPVEDSGPFPNLVETLPDAPPPPRRPNGTSFEGHRAPRRGRRNGRDPATNNPPRWALRWPP